MAKPSNIEDCVTIVTRMTDCVTIVTKGRNGILKSLSHGANAVLKKIDQQDNSPNMGETKKQEFDPGSE